MFDIVQIVFWLSLSTWFGGVLFIALAAPVIVRTVRDANPVLPTTLSVNLEGQHGTLLAGSIIGQIMSLLFPVELACAGGVLLGLVGQWVLIPHDGPRLIQSLLRSALFLSATLLLLYHWRVVWPRLWRSRQEYLDHADEPDIANPALDQFDRLQAESTTVLRNLLFLLLGVILFSASISRAITMSL